MAGTINLHEMSNVDKIRLMEDIWQNLTMHAPELSSPAWHEDILKIREELISSETEAYEDWETAKNQLRADLP